MVDVRKRYKSIFYLLVLILCSQTALNAQEEITWELLGNTRFDSKYDSLSGMNFYYPTFGSQLLEKDGKEVYIQGYMLPLDPKQNYFILSKNPMAACFFCGKSGPETILELQLENKHGRVYKMDEIVTFTGRLRLNEKDINYCNFILESAKEVW